MVNSARCRGDLPLQGLKRLCRIVADRRPALHAAGTFHPFSARVCIRDAHSPRNLCTTDGNAAKLAFGSVRIACLHVTGGNSALSTQTPHSRHLAVENHARGGWQIERGEEIVARAVSGDFVVGQTQKASARSAHGRPIVEQTQVSSGPDHGALPVCSGIETHDRWIVSGSHHPGIAQILDKVN